MATIVIVEDHPIVREGVKAYLTQKTSHHVLAECEDGLSALKAVDELRPDVLVVDLRLPGLDGLEVTRRVTEKYPWTKVVVLSMHACDSFVSRALHFGASAYVLKNSDIKDLKDAIDSAIAGRHFLSRALSAGLDRAGAPRDRYDALTSREREILQLVAEGKSAHDIADTLFISVRTVEKHRSNLMKKLELHSHAEVIRYALERELMPLSLQEKSSTSA